MTTETNHHHDSSPPLEIPPEFWSSVEDLDQLEPPPLGGATPTLERLVPSPFPRSGFPLIGFLATVYDHVADFAQARHDADVRKSGPS
ncbi:MAG: hypothetical protein GY842_06095 [bacterium]|nr:hypothetical protein [bacterium]